MSAAVHVGVDLGGTNIRAAALTSDGGHGPVARAALDGSTGAPGVLRQMARLVEEVSDGAGGRLAGIGVAVAGPVDRETGVVSNPWTLASMAGADVRSPFVREFDVPVIVENDTDAAGLGEYFYGAGRGVDSLAMVTLGTGVGVSLVREGSLLRGTGGYHPEAGHHSIADSGPECYCGLVGCWEALASGTALELAARTAIDEGVWVPEAPVDSAEDVTAAADRGDPFAQGLLDDLGFHVGRGLRNVEAFFAPATIAIGGGLGTRLDLLSASIERGRLPASALNLRAQVVRAALGDSAGALGAACAIRDKIQGSH